MIDLKRSVSQSDGGELFSPWKSHPSDSINP
jgi:hypothetical protein